MPTRKQTIAVAVYNCVEGHEAEQEAWKKRYVSMAQRMPVMIRESGLLQTITYIQARGDDGDKACLTDVVGVVFPNSTVDAFATRLRACEVHEYMYWTKMVIDSIIWFKRIAKVNLEG